MNKFNEICLLRAFINDVTPNPREEGKMPLKKMGTACITDTVVTIMGNFKSKKQ